MILLLIMSYINVLCKYFGDLYFRFADIFMRRMKLFLITLFLGAVAASAWFFILWQKYIPFNLSKLSQRVTKCFTCDLREPWPIADHLL